MSYDWWQSGGKDYNVKYKLGYNKEALTACVAQPACRQFPQAAQARLRKRTCHGVVPLKKVQHASHNRSATHMHGAVLCKQCFCWQACRESWAQYWWQSMSGMQIRATSKVLFTSITPRAACMPQAATRSVKASMMDSYEGFSSILSWGSLNVSTRS